MKNLLSKLTAPQAFLTAVFCWLMVVVIQVAFYTGTTYFNDMSLGEWVFFILGIIFVIISMLKFAGMLPTKSDKWKS